MKQVTSDAGILIGMARGYYEEMCIRDRGNTTQYVTKVTVPKGTVIYEGVAAPQTVNGGAGQLLGGGNQIYIPEVNANWFK